VCARSDDLEAAALLEAPKAAIKSPSIERNSARRRVRRSFQRHERHEARITGLRQRRGRLVAHREALGEERFHLLDERRARQLVREHRVKPIVTARRRLGLQLRESLEQRR